MDKNKVFNIAAIGILTQGKKSYAGRCVYNDGAGSYCAVGHLAKDKFEYGGKYEGTSLSDLDWLAMEDQINYHDTFANLLHEACGASTHDDYAFLNRLQKIHDLYDVVDWPSALRSFATVHDLDLTPEFEAAAANFTNQTNQTQENQ